MEGILEVDQDNKPTIPSGGGRNVFQVIWQRRGLIFFGVVLGITMGLLAYSQRPSVYRSSAQVLIVKKQDANALQKTVGDSRIAVMDDYVATHLIVIRSPIVIGMAVKQWELGSLNSLQGRDPVSSIKNGLVAEREGSKDGATGAGNNVLNLSYSSSDPGDAEKILKSIIDSYKDFLDQTYERTSKKQLDTLHEAIVQLTDQLKEKEKEYQNFLVECPVFILTDKEAPFYVGKIRDYEKKESDFREIAESIGQRITAVEDAIDENEPREVILALVERQFEKGMLNQNREKKENAKELEKSLLPLLAKEADLLNFYGVDHPEVLRVRDLIKMTEKFHQRIEEISREGEMKSLSTDPIRNMLQVLESERQQAQLNHDLYSKLLKEVKGAAQRDDIWYKKDLGYRENIKRTRTILDSNLQNSDQINLILASKGGLEATKLAEPSPGGKTSPILWQFLLMGAALGFMAAAGSSYLLDIADKSFRTPEEIRRRLGLPIVGHVPYVPTTSEPVMKVDAAGNSVELDAGLLAFHLPMSPASEAFRGIRTALYFNTHGKRHNVIQVTSPNMGDGKTTLITNLAVSIAQSGRKVLIVDADLRRPRVHRAFGLTGKIGLAEVIAGTADLDEAIQITIVPNLSVLPCGRRPQNPAELLTSPRFEDVIDDLRSAFDYVLVDTPPLLAVSDPCIVASRVDGLILTIRLSKNGRPAAERARHSLLALKTNCIGVVVNGVGKHAGMTGYGYEHYHYSDEYTTSYTSMDDGVMDAPIESFTGHKSPETIGRAETGPVANSVEPSSNGHSSHTLKGE